MNDKSTLDDDNIAKADARRSVSTTGYARRDAGQRKARRTSTRKPVDMAAPGATRASARRRVNGFLLVGVALLLGAAVWVYASISAASRMTETEAVVVGFSHDGYDAGHYRTVYRFVTASGEAVEVTGQMATTSPSADPGDGDRLYYDPAHPADGVIFAGFFERWFGVGILTILGTVFAGIGVLVGRDGSSSTEPGQTAGHASGAKSQSEAMSMMAGLALVAGLPLLLGTGLLGGAGALYVHNQKQVRDYVHTTGQIVGMAERKRSDRGAGSMYSAIVTFRTDTGRTITFAQGSSSSNSLNTGDTVRVLYDPRNPDRAVVRSFGEQWGAILILCAIGLPFVAVGVGFGGCAALDAWRYRRKKRKVR